MANGYGSSSSSSPSSSTTMTSATTTSTRTAGARRTTPITTTTSTAMGDLALVSSITNEAFNIPRKIYSLPLKSDRIELLISPKKLYSIDARHFKTRYLPKEISDVEFTNVGDDIVATFFLRKEIKSKTNVVVEVPIDGIGYFKQDNFDIIQTVNQIGEVSINDRSRYQRSILDNEIRYNIKNKLGKKELVFSKSFSVAKDFKFIKPPTYTIDGNAARYEVITKIKRNHLKRINSMTFDLYYTSPQSLTMSKNSEINFSLMTKRYNLEGYTNNKQDIIYFIDKGRNPGPLGGIKKMTVRGVPGSAFSFLVSNSSGLMYDIKTGSFSSSGNAIEGVIPKIMPGKSYGEAIIRIDIPKSTSAETISTQFINKEDAEIQKAKIRELGLEKLEEITAGGKIEEVKKVSLTIPTLTFNVTSTGYLGPKVKIVASGVTTTSQAVFLGNEGREALVFKESGSYAFKFSVSSGTASKLVQITRQPLFVMPEYPTDNYVAWDSNETKKANALTSADVDIPSDWDWSSVEKGANVIINMRAIGVGKILDTKTVDEDGYDASVYAEVIVTGEIQVKNVGDTSSSLALNLNNFLSIV